MKHIFLLLSFLIISPYLSWSSDIQWELVKLGWTRSVLRVSGKIIPKEGALSIESARIQGRITSILKHEGEIVEAGDPLFTINSAECISLSEEKYVAKSRNIQELISGTKRREEQLGLKVSGVKCEILSTHSGILTKRYIELGSTFNVGDQLVTILDIGNLMVELEVPEQDLSRIREGESVHLRLASYPEHNLLTSIQRILPTIDPVTRTSKVRLAPVSLPKGATLDALVFAEIETGTNQRILKVPISAVVFQHNHRYVVKKTTTIPIPVAVEVLDESNNFSSIRPLSKNDLKTGDEVAWKGAIFLLNQRGITE